MAQSEDPKAHQAAPGSLYREAWGYSLPPEASRGVHPTTEAEAAMTYSDINAAYGDAPRSTVETNIAAQVSAIRAISTAYADRGCEGPGAAMDAIRDVLGMAPIPIEDRGQKAARNG